MAERLRVKRLQLAPPRPVDRFQEGSPPLKVIHGGDPSPKSTGTEGDQKPATATELDQNLQIIRGGHGPFDESHIDRAGEDAFRAPHREVGDSKALRQLRKLSLAVKEGQLTAGAGSESRYGDGRPVHSAPGIPVS